jgi:nicotinamidase-related amidase
MAITTVDPKSALIVVDLQNGIVSFPTVHPIAGVTQVVITGVATSAGVESTARQAHELGSNVTLAVDAMTDMNGDAHVNSVERVFPRLGETGTTAEITDLLR